MNLLLCNDDGIYSAGIRALAQELNKHYTVAVVAPENQRSGFGHGITCFEPVRVRETKLEDLPDVKAYAINGTPADCVRLGCTSLGLDVDMIVSGINHGANLGSDVLYSGTVGAAMEGALLGKPSISMSLANHEATDFSVAARAAHWAVKYVKSNPLARGMILNVNVPVLPASEIKGVRVARLCLQTYQGSHACYEDPYGMKHFWMPLGNKESHCDHQADYDEKWLGDGYITITPIHYDITAYEYMNKIDTSCFDISLLEE